MPDHLHTFFAIDMKSFFASIECVERGLDPLTANLVVADASRTNKTICLAVSPALKAKGVPGRPRLFEVEQIVKRIKASTGEEVSYITAVPRMQLYMDYSTKIYSIYLNYVSPQDIHVYSVDEVFMDVTAYLHLYRNADGSPTTAHDLAMRIIKDVLAQTGITATAGIGTNLYLAKVAMDISAKHKEADADGVRIAELDEITYRRELWGHRPLTDFWMVGRGKVKRLEAMGIQTMGELARLSLDSAGEDLLFKAFGVDAELLIDHAWGVETCRMRDIKSYRNNTHSLGAGQVLMRGYQYEEGLMIVKEMADSLVLDLVRQGMVAESINVAITYDREIPKGIRYTGPMVTDRYGRTVPKSVNGTAKFVEETASPSGYIIVSRSKPVKGAAVSHTSSTALITSAAAAVYSSIVDKRLLVRKVTLSLNNVIPECDAVADGQAQQISLLDFMKSDEELEAERIKAEQAEREKKLQHALLQIKDRFGKNAVMMGTSYQEGATGRERNGQVGGHKK